MTKRYNVLTRCLAALTLMFVYVVSASAILVGTSTTPAQARGWGRGYARGYSRGRGYGYGYGRGYGYYGAPIVRGGGCYYRYGRYICPY